MLNLAGPVCSASYQNLTKFWLALPRDAWGPAFVKLEYDLDVDNLDFFHLDFLHLETLVHQLSNSPTKLKMQQSLITQRRPSYSRPSKWKFLSVSL